MKHSHFLLVLSATLGSMVLATATGCSKDSEVATPGTPTTPTGPVIPTTGIAAVKGTVLLSTADISRLRSQPQKYDALIKQGTSKLTYEPKPVVIFAPDPHYGPDGPDGSGESDKQLALDAQAAYQSALAYVLTNDVRYAATAQRIIDAWAGTLKQVTTEQGKAGINFSMPYLIIAASWVREANSWNSATFDAFLQAVVLPQASSDKTNNHGLWGNFMEASAATYLGDGKLMTKARTRWQDLLRGEVEADGTMPQEMERSNTTNWRGGPDKGIKGMAYTHFTLLPAGMTAKIFADQNQPVWDSEGGKLLKLAFDKAASWTQYPATFPYYASNNGQLLGVRDAAYFPLLLRYYPNADAQAAVQQGGLGANGFRLLELFAQ